MIKRFLKFVLLYVMVLLITSGTALAAWEFFFPTLITDTSNTTRTYYPVMLGYGAQPLIDSTKISASGNNTNMQIGSANISYMLATGNVTAVIPNLPAGGVVTADLYTGYTPLQSGFPIITGSGGYVTVLDDGTLEPGAAFEAEVSGWWDTDAGADKNSIYKDDAFSLFVSPTVSGNITATIPQTGVNGGNHEVNDTDHTVNLPINIENNDLILVFFTTDGNSAINFPAGWTQLYQNANGVDVNHGAWYRVAGAAENATVAVTTANAQMTSHTSYLIETYTGVPEAAAAATGSSVNPDSPNLAPTWGNQPALWFSVVGTDRGGKAVNAYPANYDDGRVDTNVSYGDGCGTINSRRTLTAAGENPGAYTLNGGAESWVANTVAVRDGVIAEYPEVSVTATGVASGNHTVRVTQSPALDFVRANSDWVSIPDDPAFSFTDGLGNDKPFSIVAWINLDDATNSSIVSKFLAANYEWRFHTDAADKLTLKLFNPDASKQMGRTSDAITGYEGSWIQLVATYDGTEVVGGIDLYVNAAVADTTDSIVGVYDGMTNGTALLEVGSMKGGTDGFLDGLLGYVKIYDGVLTPDEILTDYTGGHKATDLVAWYKLDEGVGNPQDSSGNGHHATANTADWIVSYLGIFVDGILRDGTTGVTVPNNNNDWVFSQNDVLPYTDNITIDVGGVEQLYLAPNTMISGTTIPDRSINSNDGTITWGSNTLVGLSYGEMTSYESWIATVGEVAGFAMTSASLPATWFAAGENVADLPFYDSFIVVANQTGKPVQSYYFMAIIGVAFGTFLGIIVFTRSALLAYIAMVIVFCIGSSMTIVPAWIIFVLIVVGAGIMYLYKQVAY